MKQQEYIAQNAKGFEGDTILKEKFKSIIDKCIASGVIVDWFLFNAHSMRIAPPLTITEEEIISSCEVILKSL